MDDFLDQWLSNVLDNREDKSWSPNLFACAAVAEKYGSIGIYEIAADGTLADGKIEVRDDGGTVMAYYEGSL